MRETAVKTPSERGERILDRAGITEEGNGLFGVVDDLKLTLDDP